MTVSAARPAPPAHGVARSRRLVSLFRREATDPAAFYTFLAADTTATIERHRRLAGARTLDIGGGPGYVAEAFRAAGASCHIVEFAFEELSLHGRTPEGAAQGDGCALPIATGSIDVVHSSNVLEHVPHPERMLAEMVRVLAEGGVGYLSFTNWFSPWGGHETSPWHYAGGAWAAERYERRYGCPPKNRFGTSLHPVHVADVMQWFRAREDVDVVWAGPRYLPRWTRPVVRVPIVREVVTWNLELVFRHR